MHSIGTHCILFELCVTEKKERKKVDKIEIFKFGFLDLVKVSGACRIILAIEYHRDVICKLFFTPLLHFSGGCSYILCTGSHFKITKKYYRYLLMRPNHDYTILKIAYVQCMVAI